MVAVVTLTKDRLDFVTRLLNFYESAGVVISLYIGDSSSLAIQENLLRQIKKIKSIHVHHVNCLGLNDRQSFWKVLNQVSQKYVAFHGDDDFLIPSTIISFAEYLSQNQDCRTVQGRALAFSTRGDGAFGEIDYCDDYWGKPEIQENQCSERLKAFSQSYFVNLFSVHRTDQLIDDFRLFAEIKDRSFSEIGACFLTALRGKSKFLDALYLIRQVHKQRHTMNTRVDWLITKGWFPSYRLLRAVLMSELRRSPENMKCADCRELLGESLDAYIQKAISGPPKRRFSLVEILKSSFGAQLKSELKWIRNLISPNRDLTYTRLKCANSKYNREFMLVLRNVTVPNGNR